MSNVIINEVKFKKIAKIINQRYATAIICGKVGEKYPELSIDECVLPHNSILNALAEAFGFNNYDHIQKIFNKEENNKEKSKKVESNAILKMDKSLLSGLFKYYLLEGTRADQWIKRASTLLDVALDLFYYRVKNESNFELTINNLESCFYYDTLYQYLDNDFKDIDLKHAISSYFINTPGWSSDRVTHGSIEQHGYLQAQFTGLFLLIKKFNDNVIIFNKDLNWESKNSEEIEYLENFSKIKEKINVFMKNNDNLLLCDLIKIYKETASVEQRKSIILIIEFVINNIDIVKMIVKQ